MNALEMLVMLEIAIEDANPTLSFVEFEGASPADHRNLRLQDLAARTEALLDQLPDAERRIAALALLEAAFQKECPGKPFPPLETRLADIKSL